jgi:hypothetical protein
MAQLRHLLPRDVADAKLEPPAVANVITIVPVQTISAESLHVGDSNQEPEVAKPQ